MQTIKNDWAYHVWVQNINPFNRFDAIATFIETIVEHLHSNSRHLTYNCPNSRYIFHVFATHKYLTGRNDLVTCFGIIFLTNHTVHWEFSIDFAHNMANSIDSKRSHENNWLWFVGRRWSSSSAHYRFGINFILNECKYMCHKLHDVRSLSKNECVSICILNGVAYATASVYLHALPPYQFKRASVCRYPDSVILNSRDNNEK